jgi:hypothetical protein
MPVTIIAISGFAYWGRFAQYTEEAEMTVPTNGAFTAAMGRSWVVPFWELPGKYVGIAFPFAIILWILFLFE